MAIFTILQYSFIQNAFLAGTCVAIIAAVAGYFMVIRGLTFAGHALPNIGFAGAAGAVLLGIDPVIGLYIFTIGASLGIALLGREVTERDTSIGIIMTFALGMGILLPIILWVSYTCLGIFFAANSAWPVSFYIATLSFGVYLPVRLLSPLWIGRRARKLAITRQNTSLSPGSPAEWEQSDSVPTTGRVPGSTR